jgi:hypothetical protein
LVVMTCFSSFQMDVTFRSEEKATGVARRSFSPQGAASSRTNVGAIDETCPPVATK